MSDVSAPPTPDTSSRYRDIHHRQTMTFLGIVAGVLAVGFIALLGWQGIISLGGDGRPSAVPCPTPIQTAASSVSTRVNVYNGSETRGLASAVAKELQLRGFRVPTIANAPEGTSVAAAVQVRYGPEGETHARTVAVQFRGQIEMLTDDARTDDLVDLVIGPRYRGMAPVPEALAQLQPLPAASPEGCLPADEEEAQRPLVKDPRPPKTTASPKATS